MVVPRGDGERVDERRVRGQHGQEDVAHVAQDEGHLRPAGFGGSQASAGDRDSDGAAVAASEVDPLPAAGGRSDVTETHALIYRPEYLVFYLAKTVLPSGLSPLYARPEAASLLEPRYGLCLLAVLALTAALWRRRRESREDSPE